MVIREGSCLEIVAKDIVPGDVVVINADQQKEIPCDIVFFESDGLKVENATITGEHEPTKIDPDL